MNTDKRNLYKTGRIISENAFCQILGFDSGEGEAGHYKIGSVVYPDRQTTDFGGALSIPADQIDSLVL